MLQALPLVFVLAGVALYTVLAGADFGAGFWQLSAGGGEQAERIREHAHDSMAAVWEANHVWLIFVLTVFWTTYPKAFGAIFTTLAVALFIAVMGIVFRGAAYALRAGASSRRESSTIDTIFSLSSILTPFALGAAVGGIASDRVPANGAGDLWSSWLNPTSIFIGVLAVTNCAYLAAVYLAADAARRGEDDLERAFRSRALATGVIAGAVAFGGLFVVNGDDHQLVHSLLSGDALAAVIVSALAGAGTLGLVYARRFEAARYTAAIAVAAVILGWTLARWPTILPGLTIDQAAAGHDTLVWVVVAVLAGGAILFPSLALLFHLAVTGRFAAAEAPLVGPTAEPLASFRTGMLARTSVALLIAGFALLTVADAGWAHAIGVLCLLAFVVIAFVAIVPGALTEESRASRR
jgi:cytochrome bd ubiquinol oxidase subunit II